MSHQASINAFLKLVAQEVAIICDGIGIEAEDVDVSIGVIQGNAQVIVTDRELGQLFCGALRVGKVHEDAPLLTAGRIHTAIEAQLKRLRGAATMSLCSDTRTLTCPVEKSSPLGSPRLHHH